MVVPGQPGFWSFITGRSLGGIASTIHSRRRLSNCPQVIILGSLFEGLKVSVSLSSQVLLICLMAVSTLAAFLALLLHICTLAHLYSIWNFHFLALQQFCDLLLMLLFMFSLCILSLCEPILHNKLPRWDNKDNFELWTFVPPPKICHLECINV